MLNSVATVRKKKALHLCRAGCLKNQNKKHAHNTWSIMGANAHWSVMCSYPVTQSAEYMLHHVSTWLIRDRGADWELPVQCWSCCGSREWSSVSSALSSLFPTLYREDLSSSFELFLLLGLHFATSAFFQLLLYWRKKKEFWCCIKDSRGHARCMESDNVLTINVFVCKTERTQVEKRKW